jgi:hypothetical protein
LRSNGSAVILGCWSPELWPENGMNKANKFSTALINTKTSLLHYIEFMDTGLRQVFGLLYATCQIFETTLFFTNNHHINPKRSLPAASWQTTMLDPLPTPPLPIKQHLMTSTIFLGL